MQHSPVFVLHEISRLPNTSLHRQPGIELHFSHRGRGSYHAGDRLFVHSGCDVVVTSGAEPHQVVANLRTGFTRTAVCLASPVPEWLTSVPEFAGLTSLLEVDRPIQLYFPPDAWQEAEEHLQRMDREHRERKAAWRSALFAHLIQVLILIKRSASSSERPADNYIAHCLNYIDSNLREDLLLVDLAKEVAVTPKHLSREFRRTVGVPLGEHIWRRRVAKAKDLLSARPDLPIREVGLRCGFKTASHFARKFTEVSGSTPTDYRTRPAPSLVPAP